jgi:hypothetical protein
MNRLTNSVAPEPEGSSPHSQQPATEQLVSLNPDDLKGLF